MIFTKGGGIVQRSRGIKPKDLEDEFDLLFGGPRLGDWKVKTNQWAPEEATEHMHFLHAIVKLSKQGRPWAVVRDIEMAYRKGMHCGKYTSWDDLNQLSSLVVLTAPFAGKRSKSRNSKQPSHDSSDDEQESTQKKKKIKKTKKLTFKHTKDSKGQTLCRNWNNGFACKANCEHSHRCAVCLKDHKAVDHH